MNKLYCELELAGEQTGEKEVQKCTKDNCIPPEEHRYKVESIKTDK